MAKDIPKSVMCKCGHLSPFHPWVYAHWNDLLIFTCRECGKQYEMLAGKVLREVKSSKPVED